jgi:plastocyanin
MTHAGNMVCFIIMMGLVRDQAHRMMNPCPQTFFPVSHKKRELLMSGSEPYYMHVRSGPVTLLTGVLLIMAALIFVAGCTNLSPPAVPPTPVYTPQTTILIESASVNPQILVVDRGVTVTFLNLDMGRHFITSDPGDPDSFTSPLLENNQRYQFTFTVPGTYGYHCTDNADIKGTVIVKS